ncbi:MAG: Ni/Fe-hydrogenase, b-type cytochrome subunit [Deltaproteobacteria bacterium HGW-Deltaproteobacteria-13]|nr:MAG: Ni/Fe-hydrogenase, b-type cytochrome subunit [Deltaproteobacteria bacterium HGW-Deltaproteobacteria-13]
MEKFTSEKEWSVAMRINHWAMALSIFILIVTGFYIADPFTVSRGETVGKFLMGNVRFVHILFGVFLVFLFFWRVYLAFFSRFHADWKDFFAWTNIKCTIDQIKFYLLITKKGPDYKTLYGPMQSLAYLGLMFMVFVIVITGLILMGAGYHAGFTAICYKILRPIENLMGGLAVVRYVHHLFTWFFILFIVVHMYMAFWYDAILKKGTISSMISGNIFKKLEE